MVPCLRRKKPTIARSNGSHKDGQTSNKELKTIGACIITQDMVDKAESMSVLLTLLEKSVVKLLCEGRYSLLKETKMIDILRALVGPVPLSIMNHETTNRTQIWKHIRQACEKDSLILGLGPMKSKDLIALMKGKVGIIENCFQFKRNDGKPEQLLLINDVKTSRGSPIRFLNWTGKWSEQTYMSSQNEPRTEWTEELK